MKALLKLSLAIVVFASVFPLHNAWAQAKRNPDIAFNPVTNRYLMVYEEESGAGTVIKGQFRNLDGTTVAGSEVVLSPDRVSQGCFYASFDSENGAVTTPTNCPFNKNPSVAYNNGQYMIAWEVRGTAATPASAPDNEFSSIFVRIVDAGTLNALPGFEEGVLISKVYLAANNSESSCGDKHVCNDGHLQAWSQAVNPDVAARLNGGGFVVTWQTNKDFIGCADAERRHAWAVYGRYVDQAFSAAPGSSNPQPFAVFKDDSTMTEICEPLSNVDNGANPSIAYNQAGNDFVIAYQAGRASGGNNSIGAKRFTINASGAADISGSAMPTVLASVDGSSLGEPSLASYGSNYYLVASDGTNIRGKSFSSATIDSSVPAVIDLGSGNKTTPRVSSNLGAGGQRPSGTNTTPERLVVTYEQAGDLRAAVLNDALAVTTGPVNVSTGIAANNRSGDVASDYHDFVTAWQGNASGDKVFAALIDSEGPVPSPSPDVSPNPAPTVPGLLTPSDGVTFAPTRVYISWSAATDPDGGAVTYNVYFGENVIPATPQVTGLSVLEYVIGPETQAVTGITPLASKVYKWKVEAVDNEGQKTSTAVRSLNTDNSVVGWWRFDEDPTGAVCGGGGAGETVCDYSGNNNHGVPNGGIPWLAPPNPMLLGGALDFDGVNDTVSVQNNANLNFPTGAQFSIEGRIKPDSADAFIVSKGSGGAGLEHGNYSLLVRTSFQVGLTFRNTDAILPTYFVTTTLTPAVYNHVLISYTFGSGASIKAFINGVLSGGTWLNASGTPGPTGNEPPTTNSQGLVVSGRSAMASNFYNGVADDIIIFNKSLSNEESMNHYEASIP